MFWHYLARRGVTLRPTDKMLIGFVLVTLTMAMMATTGFLTSEAAKVSVMWEIAAYVVMPNHAHLLVTPRVTARQWLGPLKGFTAHETNRMLERTGPFWQDESYDHLVRDEPEFWRIRNYIEQNPVKAGLVALPEQYPWSSAAPGRSPAAG